MIKDMPTIVLVGSLLDAFVKIGLISILIHYYEFYKNKRFYFSTIILGIYVFLSYMLTDNAIRTVFFFLFPIFLEWFILNFKKHSLITITVVTFAVWVTMALADVFCGIFLEICFNIDMPSFRKNILAVIIGNSMILFAMTSFYLIRPIRTFIYKISNLSVSKDNKYIVLMIFTSVVLFGFAFYICHFYLSTTLILSIIFIMVVVYTIIAVITIKEFNQKNKIQTEYDILLTNLSEYENLLDRQRILNHENKNQLLVIRGMINKNENAIEYIDSLVDNHYKDSDELIMKTNRIPSGGLKGLIYYKMLIMKDRNIKMSLEVNSSVNKINFSSISTNTNQELCKIVGVFLDNAIQEVENLNDKNINIIVENEKNNLIIKISNNYGYSNINNVGEKGYTTKGNGHGYGLRLVKNIIDNNKMFEHKMEINGKVFSQIVMLKIKND